MKNKIILYVAATILLPLFAYLEYFTGGRYEFAFFNLATIVILTWYGGRNVGIILSVVASLLIFEGNFLSKPPDFDLWVLIWNGFWTFILLFTSIFFTLMLKRSLENEKKLSRTDSLTGLPNRRFFEEVAQMGFEMSKRKKLPVSLAFFDLDNFKTVNDTMGHDEGDRLLVTIAEILAKGIRQSDLVARMGGDEFIIFFPETDEKKAEEIILRLQVDIVAQAEKNKWPVSCSVGFVVDYSHENSTEALIQKADDLMYDVKKAGKNAVKSQVLG